MRKLASIQRIRSLSPIEGADTIEKAIVLGWSLVVKKGEFKLNDLCVYVEIDSVLPELHVFEFLRSARFRIRTVKLRGQVSQGICFPLDVLPSGITPGENMEVTDILGITKYEPPIPLSLSGLMKGVFPSFIPKTDETRVQVMQDELDQYKGLTCYVTEKIDGTSVTFFRNNGMFGVCSRNMELYEGDNAYWQIAKALQIEDRLTKLNRNVAIQGELVGEGIQGNKLGLKGKSVYFFNLFWIDEYRYAGYNEWKKVFDEELYLNTVPVIQDNYSLSNNIDELLTKAERTSAINNKIQAEGIVIRVKESKELISFKAVNNKFLLKYED